MKGESAEYYEKGRMEVNKQEIYSASRGLCKQKEKDESDEATHSYAEKKERKNDA